MNTPILANIIVDTFLHGGIIMWPLLALSLFAVSVVAERVVWWIATARAHDPKALLATYDALASGDRRTALQLANASRDPRLRVISHSLSHPETSADVATQVVIAEELKGAQRFQGAMDTTITLAPLLGLLGTVTGIMQSFKFVGGDQDLAVNKVSGGIGEALIATAAGLGIAIFTLIPFNVFGGKAEKLETDLETVGKNVRLLPERARQRQSSELDLAEAQH